MRKTIWMLLFLFLVFPSLTHGAEDTPWDSTRSPELGKLLRELSALYGTDTVALLSQLNDASIHHQSSVLTATVSIPGQESSNNATFLTFRVETGIIFNTRAAEQADRLSSLWQHLLERAFSHFDTLTIPTDGVLVDLISHCKAIAEGEQLVDHVDDPGPVEDVKFYFLGDPLRAYLGKKLSAAELIQGSVILVNDVPVKWALPAPATEATLPNDSNNRVGEILSPDS
ncbi:MAG: hypothetical protein AB7G75_26220 [Candidatus Binatia bacterium]